MLCYAMFDYAIVKQLLDYCTNTLPDLQDNKLLKQLYIILY